MSRWSGSRERPRAAGTRPGQCRTVDQVPNIARLVLNGVGEPMMVRSLPRMIRYLKERGTYVVFGPIGAL